MNLVFATNNLNKLKEIEALLHNKFTLKSLEDIGCNEDVPEEGETLEANALQKARYIHDKYKCNCFADDTGLEVMALNNAPGVYSARYAGPQRNSEDNMRKLLLELKNCDNRSARFRTVIALIIDNKEYLFEGIAEGEITKELHGEKGFGYDPVFKPKGYQKTFAQMSMEEKNRISHRGIAFNKLKAFLISKVQ